MQIHIPRVLNLFATFVCPFTDANTLNDNLVAVVEGYPALLASLNRFWTEFGVFSVDKVIVLSRNSVRV